MNLIDRYVLRRFATFFIFSMLAALSIYLIIDPIENLDKFLDKNVPTQDIIRYYVLYVPYIVYVTFPVAVLLATMFCIGGLTTTNELTAMTASGVPLFRHLMMLGGVGLVLSLFIFWWGETVVPDTNRERMTIWRQQVREREDWRLTDQGQVYLQVGQERVLHMDLYQPTERTARGIDLYTLKEGRIARRVTARTLTYDTTGWQMHDIIDRQFTNGAEIVATDSIRSVTLPIEPTDMVELKVEPEEMSMGQLLRFAERIEQTGGNADRWWVDIHSKVALPFAGVIIILFGLPVSAVPRRSGVIFGVTVSLFISFLYFGIMQIGKVMGYKEILPPLLAAWIGNLLFLAIGIYLFRRAPR